MLQEIRLDIFLLHEFFVYAEWIELAYNEAVFLSHRICNPTIALVPN
jgi:hypothetical protein